MIAYIIRRLILLPITLLAIICVNFVIINLAPGDPTTYLEINPMSEGRSSENQTSGAEDDPQRLFRMRYGLNLPIFFNGWIFETQEEIRSQVEEVAPFMVKPYHFKASKQVEQSEKKKLLYDKAPFQMVALLGIIQDETIPFDIRQGASAIMVKGAQRLGIASLFLSASDRRLNQEIAYENELVQNWILQGDAQDGQRLRCWYEMIQKRADLTQFRGLSNPERILQALFYTRFVKYMSRVIHLDFGTLRNNSQRLVTQEVLQRLPISLFLAIIPLIASFFISLPIGFMMAIYHRRSIDHILNLSLLSMYAAPVFVVAPFLIEFASGQLQLPGMPMPLPSSGFHSGKSTYDLLSSWQRLLDILNHVFLPMIAVSYATLAAKSRLVRNAILEVLRQDYILNARARGISSYNLYSHHVLKNASIPLVTSLAGSLGIILGGSLIVETMFDIDGFGKFFYEAIIKRDINVVMFSTIAGSLLTLISYLVADLLYTWLDPRVQIQR
jgi:peptide/nickel transport system permease protein